MSDHPLVSSSPELEKYALLIGTCGSTKNSMELHCVERDIRDMRAKLIGIVPSTLFSPSITDFPRIWLLGEEHHYVDERLSPGVPAPDARKYRKYPYFYCSHPVEGQWKSSAIQMKELKGFRTQAHGARAKYFFLCKCVPAVRTTSEH